MSNPHPPSEKWYREPWPWLLMAGPAAVIVAGIFTTWVAVAGRDPMVTDDYYKQGLAINRSLAREKEAARRGVSARIMTGAGKITVRLTGADAPEAIFLTLSHATLGDLDQRLRLARSVAAPSESAYESTLPPTAAGKWRYVIEDARGEWRLSGDWRNTQ